jgi:hypothetical protein
MSLLLPNKTFWNEYLDELLASLPEIFHVLMFLRKNTQDSIIELVVCCNMRQYRDRNLTELFCCDKLLQMLSDFQINLTLIILKDCLCPQSVCSPENGESTTQTEPK